MNNLLPPAAGRSQVTLDPAVAALTSATGELAEWRAHQTDVAAGRSYVAAGHNAVAWIDAAIRALHDARRQLLSEIRQDEIERDIRVEQLLARLATERSARAYTREDEPATDDPLPPGVEGRSLGRHATNGDNGVR